MKTYIVFTPASLILNIENNNTLGTISFHGNLDFFVS